jgi:hypothetical protein
MHLFKVTFCAFSAAFLFGSCATIYSGRQDYVHIATYPSGASVKINGKNMGQTPLTMTVNRSVAGKNVSLELPGVGGKDFRLMRKINPWFILDAPTGFGALVDIASGSVVRYRPRFYEIPLADSLQKAMYFNLNDNFFVQDRNNRTTYCKPLLLEDASAFAFLFNSFENLESKPVKIKIRDVQRFKCIKQETSNFFLITLYKRYYDVIYERHPINPEKPGKNHVFMEMLLKNGDFRLVVLNNESVTFDGGHSPNGINHKSTYYLYNGNTFVTEITRSNYKSELLLYFANYQDVVQKLRAGKLPFRHLWKLSRNRKMVFWES